MITFYNRLGDPVHVEDTPENIKSMELAGFTRTNPVETAEVDEPVSGFLRRKATPISDVGDED